MEIADSGKQIEKDESNDDVKHPCQNSLDYPFHY
jgi:hypothetical protein